MNKDNPPAKLTRKEREALVKQYMEKYKCTHRAAKARLALDYPQHRWSMH
jgi:hypothetical protein